MLIRQVSFQKGRALTIISGAEKRYAFHRLRTYFVLMNLLCTAVSANFQVSYQKKWWPMLLRNTRRALALFSVMESLWPFQPAGSEPKEQDVALP